MTLRYKDGKALVFVLNHNGHAVNIDLGDEQYEDLLNGDTIRGAVSLSAYGVFILSAASGK